MHQLFGGPLDEKKLSFSEHKDKANRFYYNHEARTPHDLIEIIQAEMLLEEEFDKTKTALLGSGLQLCVFVKAHLS